MAFGFNQIGKPTPATATWFFRVVLYTATTLTVVCSIITEIPEPIKYSIAKYSIEAVTLVHAMSRMFGIPFPDNAEVKVSDVASMKTDTPTVK